MSAMDQMIKSNVKGVTRRENAANNYHLTQQPPRPPVSSTERFYNLLTHCFGFMTQNFIVLLYFDQPQFQTQQTANTCVISYQPRTARTKTQSQEHRGATKELDISPSGAES